MRSDDESHFRVFLRKCEEPHTTRGRRRHMAVSARASAPSGPVRCAHGGGGDALSSTFGIDRIDLRHGGGPERLSNHAQRSRRPSRGNGGAQVGAYNSKAHSAKMLAPRVDPKELPRFSQYWAQCLAAVRQASDRRRHRPGYAHFSPLLLRHRNFQRVVKAARSGEDDGSNPVDGRFCFDGGVGVAAVCPRAKSTRLRPGCPPP